MSRFLRIIGIAAFLAGIPAISRASSAYQILEWKIGVDGCQTQTLVAMAVTGWTGVSKGASTSATNGFVHGKHGDYEGMAVCDSTHGVFTFVVMGANSDQASTLVSDMLKKLENPT